MQIFILTKYTINGHKMQFRFCLYYKLITVYIFIYEFPFYQWQKPITIHQKLPTQLSTKKSYFCSWLKWFHENINWLMRIDIFYHLKNGYNSQMYAQKKRHKLLIFNISFENYIEICKLTTFSAQSFIWSISHNIYKKKISRFI